MGGSNPERIHLYNYTEYDIYFYLSATANNASDSSFFHSYNNMFIKAGQQLLYTFKAKAIGKIKFHIQKKGDQKSFDYGFTFRNGDPGSMSVYQDIDDKLEHGGGHYMSQSASDVFIIIGYSKTGDNFYTTFPMHPQAYFMPDGKNHRDYAEIYDTPGGVPTIIMACCFNLDQKDWHELGIAKPRNSSLTPGIDNSWVENDLKYISY